MIYAKLEERNAEGPRLTRSVHLPLLSERHESRANITSLRGRFVQRAKGGLSEPVVYRQIAPSTERQELLGAQRPSENRKKKHFS